jgi:hypothetical protein
MMAKKNYYLRVPHANACFFCIQASTQKYYKGNLQRIHDGCTCDVVAFKEDDVRGEKLLADQKKRSRISKKHKLNETTNSHVVKVLKKYPGIEMVEVAPSKKKGKKSVKEKKVTEKPPIENRQTFQLSDSEIEKLGNELTGLFNEAKPTPQEKKSINYYTTEKGYREIYDTSRKHDYNNVNEFLQRADLDRNLTLFRGVSTQEAQNLMQSLKNKKALDYGKRMISTSIDFSVAYGFGTDREGMTDNVASILVIKAKKTKGLGAFVRSVSESPEEEEFLMPAGKKLRPMKVTEDNWGQQKIRYIYCTMG